MATIYYHTDHDRGEFFFLQIPTFLEYFIKNFLSYKTCHDNYEHSEKKDK